MHPGNVGSPVVLSTGTVTVDADGSFDYTHNGDEVYSDSFTYALSDGSNSSGTVSVDITVTPVNDNTPNGVADTYGPVLEGAMLNVPAASGVLDNDSDPDGRSDVCST